MVPVGFGCGTLLARRPLLAVLAGRQWWMVAGCPSLCRWAVLLWCPGASSTCARQRPDSRSGPACCISAKVNEQWTCWLRFVPILLFKKWPTLMPWMFRMPGCFEESERDRFPAGKSCHQQDPRSMGMKFGFKSVRTEGAEAYYKSNIVQLSTGGACSLSIALESARTRFFGGCQKLDVGNTVTRLEVYPRFKVGSRWLNKPKIGKTSAHIGEKGPTCQMPQPESNIGQTWGPRAH